MDIRPQLTNHAKQIVRDHMRSDRTISLSELVEKTAREQNFNDTKKATLATLTNQQMIVETGIRDFDVAKVERPSPTGLTKSGSAPSIIEYNWPSKITQSQKSASEEDLSYERPQEKIDVTDIVRQKMDRQIVIDKENLLDKLEKCASAFDDMLGKMDFLKNIGLAKEEMDPYLSSAFSKKVGRELYQSSGVKSAGLFTSPTLHDKEGRIGDLAESINNYEFVYGAYKEAKLQLKQSEDKRTQTQKKGRILL